MKSKKTKSKKRTSQEKKTTHVALVLDKSGSMSSCYNEALEGFNAQIDVIRNHYKEGGDTFVTIVTFNDNVKVLQEAVKADKVVKLNRQTYQVDGMTAMRDAVWTAITTLERYDDEHPQTAFLVITVSDGVENRSREISSIMLANKIKKLQQTERWTFGYVGANQDLSEVTATTGILNNNMLKYTSNSVGTRAMNVSLNSAVGTYFNSRSAGVTYTANLFAPVGSAGSFTVVKPKED